MEPASTERDLASADHHGQCSSIGICEGAPSTVPAQSLILIWVGDVVQEPCATQRDTDSVSVGTAEWRARNDFSSWTQSPRHQGFSPKHIEKELCHIVPDGGSSWSPQSIMGGANLQFRQRGCPVTFQNRFDLLIHDAKSAPTVSRPEEEMVLRNGWDHFSSLQEELDADQPPRLSSRSFALSLRTERWSRVLEQPNHHRVHHPSAPFQSLVAGTVVVSLAGDRSYVQWVSQAVGSIGQTQGCMHVLGTCKRASPTERCREAGQQRRMEVLGICLASTGPSLAIDITLWSALGASGEPCSVGSLCCIRVGAPDDADARNSLRCLR